MKESRIFCKSGIAGLFLAALAFVSGAAEVMRAIFGLDPITSGSVYLNGREVHIRNTRDAINHGIAMVNEDRRTYSSSFFATC